VAADLLKLPPRDDAGVLRVVVESPRGSRAKLKYEPRLGAFAFSRPLPLGLVYPYDWGFVPGTRAADGDPVDAMVYCDAGTQPGVIVACRPIALLCVEQDGRDGGRQRNDRLIVVPAADPRAPDDLAPRVRTELEKFFRAAAKQEIEILGWSTARDADALIERSRSHG
jgi:inorganic pyrophosphatase